MKKGILSCVLGLCILLVTAGGAWGAPSGAGRLGAGYQVKMHPDSHIALFTKKPLVYTNPHLWAVYLVVMAGLGVAALILLYRQKDKELMLKQECDQQSDADPVYTLQEKQNSLLQRIKQLDEQFTAGKVDKREYEETRQKYKEQLVQVKLQLKELS